MKSKFFIFIFIVIISCSSKKDIKIDVDTLKNEGITILHNKENNNFGINHATKYINNIALYKPIDGVKNWNSNNFTHSNLLKNINSKINFKTKQQGISIFFSKTTFSKTILFHNEKLIFVDDSSNIVIYDKDLKKNKKFKIHENNFFDNYPLKFSPIIDSNTLFISDNLGTILAFDLDKFKILWKNNLSVPFVSNLSIYKESLLVVNSNGKIFSFDKKYGKINWSFETGTSSIKSYKSFKLAISDNKIIFSNDLGSIYCIDLEKQSLIWSRRLSNLNLFKNLNYFEISPPVIENKFIYFSINSGYFLQLDIISGNILWSTNVKTSTLPIINLSTIAVISDDGYFVIVDKVSGKILYSKYVLNFLKQRALVQNKDLHIRNLYLISNKFYLISNNGDFLIINSSNLDQVQILKISNSINSNLIILKDKLFVMDKNNNILLIR